MSTENTQLSYLDMLSLMKETSKQFDSEVYIPSLNKNIHTKPMNAMHLKGIIKTALSGVFVDNQFNQTVYTILKEILDPSIPSSNINTLDKICILLELRKQNVKNTIDVLVKNEKSEEKTTSVELDKLIQKLKKIKLDFTDSIISEGTYSATLNYPTLDEEFLFDRSFETTVIKNIDEKNKESTLTVPGNIFMYFMTQYIKFLTIGEHNINLTSLKVSERIGIVEKLPSGLITKIIEEIDKKFGKQLGKILEVETKIKSEDGDNSLYKGSIEISPALFT